MSLLARTVDLISYTILSLAPEFHLEEAAHGSGGFYGSTFLDRNFAHFLNKKFEKDLDWENDPEIRRTAFDYFTSKAKTTFTGYQGYRVPVHGVSDQRGVSRGRLELSIADMKAIFDPVVGDVLKLIADQIRFTPKAIKLIIMVGGFSGSPYLRKLIAENFPNIEVKVAPNWYVSLARKMSMQIASLHFIARPRL